MGRTAVIAEVDEMGFLKGLMEQDGANSWPMSKNAPCIVGFGDSIEAERRDGNFLAVTSGGVTGINPLFMSYDTLQNGCVLTYDNIAKTLTFQAGGDTVGQPVSVQGSGLYYVFSADQSQYIAAAIYASQLVAGGTVTLNPTLAGGGYVMLGGRGPIAWAQAALMQGVDAYCFAMPGAKAVDLVGQIKMARRMGVPLDCAFFQILTNNILFDISPSSINLALSQVEAAFQMRQPWESWAAAIPPQPDLGTAGRALAWSMAASGLRQLGGKYGVDILDLWESTVNPVGNAGQGLDVDNTHPHQWTAYIAGVFKLAPWVRNKINITASPWLGQAGRYDATNNPLGGMLTSTYPAGAAGGNDANSSGPVPTGFAQSRITFAGAPTMAIVSSQVARTDGVYGTWHQVQASNSASALLEYAVTTRSDAVAASPGDYLTAMHEVQIMGDAGLRDFGLKMSMPGRSSYGQFSIVEDANSGTYPADGQTMTFVVKTRAARVPAAYAGTISTSYYTRQQPGANPRVRHGRFDVFKIPAARWTVANFYKL